MAGWTGLALSSDQRSESLSEPEDRASRTLERAKRSEIGGVDGTRTRPPRAAEVVDGAAVLVLSV